MSAVPSSSSGAKQGQGTRQLAQLLFSPSSLLTDPDDQRRGRLLAVLLFVLTLCMVVGVFSRMAVRGELGWEMVASVPMLGFAYLMSRSRHLWVAAGLGLGALSFPSFVMAYQNAAIDSDLARHSLVWLALPLFFSSFVMRVRGTIIACAALLAGVVLMMGVFPKSAFHDLLMSLSILIVTAGLSVGVAVVQGRVRRLAQRELRRREGVEEELRRARDELEVRVAERTAELEAASEQLRHSQKLEAVGQLAGGVAHDFNNLLMVIQGYTEEVLADLDPADRRAEDLQEVREASNKAAVLTRRLLAFSRRQVLNPIVIDLNEVIYGMGKMMRRLISEDVSLEIKPGVDLGAVRADPGQIEQVIFNLAVNASDAMPTGGTLTISTENVTRSGEPDVPIEGQVAEQYAMISVADSGVGMTPEVQERVFEPFFTTKERGHGTGLGLATVYGIIKQSGGRIELDSEPFVGTTFRVLLPRVEASQPEATSTREALPHGTETILVVEDEIGVRRLTSRMLERLGYQVVAVDDGAAAIDYCKRRPKDIDLVLTDVVMPGLSGPECVLKIKDHCPDVGVVYMSGHAEPALVRHGVLEAGVALVHKPFTAEELAVRLRDTLDSRDVAPG